MNDARTSSNALKMLQVTRHSAKLILYTRARIREGKVRFASLTSFVLFLLIFLKIFASLQRHCRVIKQLSWFKHRFVL